MSYARRLGMEKKAAAGDGDEEADAAGGVGEDGQVDFKAGSKFAAHSASPTCCSCLSCRCPPP